MLRTTAAHGAQEDRATGMPVSNEFILALSVQERAWLRDHPVIRVVQDPGWPPVEFVDEQGEPSGMSGDYLRLVEKRLGVKFERVQNLSWREAYARLKRWEIDMTTSVAVTPQRAEFWAFTKPYLSIPIVIATQSDVVYLADIRELFGKKVAVVEGYAIEDWLSKDFPEIRPVHVKTTLDGIKMLQRGEVFAFIDNLLIIGYYQARMKASTIKIAGQTPYVNAQCMAVRKDWAPLAGILQKALESIPEVQRNDIYRKWLPVRYEHVFDYILFWKAVAVFAVILLALIFWNLKLNREIRFRKQAQKALLESEQKFRLTFNSSPDAVNINRLKDGLYEDINDGFIQLTGFTRADVAGKSALDINIWHDPADREKLVKDLQEKGFCDNLEARFRRKDGRLTTALTSARVISLKGEAHIICITRDISERKRAEAERERLLLAIEQASEIVVITDALGIIQYVNPAFEKITGYSSSETLGNAPSLLKSGRHNRAFYKSLWDTILSGKPWAGRMINKRKDGALYTGECSISPIKDATDNVVHFVWISRDITTELELEKRISQAQKMEAIGTLAGGIAHDFNNMLFPIMGLSEMLVEDLPFGSLSHKNAMQIFNAARRAAELVKQILSFSRQSDHHKAPVSMQEVLTDVLKLTRATIPSNIEITQDLQSDCGPILADPTQLHQIAMNLITNAYQAVEETGGSISVRLQETELTRDDLVGKSLEPGKYAIFTVSNTGYGIDPSVMNRIFEPYFTTKAPGKGTGIGLSVVYGIVTEHGGDIRAVSEAGKGATFNVFLPLMKNAGEVLPPEVAGPIETGSERVLLVDDEEAIVLLETQILERLGYSVTACTNSMDALEAFRASPGTFDLVLTDMTMPHLTGIQFAKELISIRPHIPIIICTGFSEKINEKKAKALGIKGFLMKPVVKSDMAQMVRRVLNKNERWYLS
jgi:PAS domain S-box-containing protein